MSTKDHIRIVCTDRGQHKPTVLTAYEPDGLGGYRESNTFSSRGHNRGKRRPSPGGPLPPAASWPGREEVVQLIGRAAMQMESANNDPRRAVRVVPPWEWATPDGDGESIPAATYACPRCTRKPQFKAAQLVNLVRGAAEAGLNTVDVSRADR